MSNSKINAIRENYHLDMLIGLLPLIVCGVFLYGPRVILLCAVAMITARSCDIIISMIRGQEFDSKDYSSIASALIFCMVLPVSIPLYIVIVTTMIVTIVGKHIFGGKDVYPFNLAALAMCSAAVNWPEHVFIAVPPFSNVDFWTGATNATLSSAGIIKSGGLPYISTFNMLLGNYAGSIGTDYILIILSVAIFLFATKRISWHIPVSFIATCSLIAVIFPRIYGVTRIESLKMEILNGALIFAAVFILNDPVTTPKNPKAKLVFGILTGALSMAFRYFGSYEIGVCFAVLLVNTMEGFIDRFVGGKVVKRSYQSDKQPPVNKEENHEANVHETVDDSLHMVKAIDEAMNILGKAEDDIDQILYSTRTIDVSEALKENDKKRSKHRRRKK